MNLKAKTPLSILAVSTMALVTLDCSEAPRVASQRAFNAQMATDESDRPVSFSDVNPGRRISFNGQRLTAEQEQRLSELESALGGQLPDQAYWYDNRSGALGVWGGPAAAILPAGLGFGGPMPPNASGGGTGVYINGREIHPMDLAKLMTLGPVMRARYWLDANGNYGFENGPVAGNLYALFGQAGNAGGGGGQQHRVLSTHDFVGGAFNEAGASFDSGSVYR